MHFVRIVLAIGAVGAGSFSRGVADFVAFPPRRNCSVSSFRILTCSAVSAGEDSRLQTVLLLTRRGSSKTDLAINFQGAHVFGSLPGGHATELQLQLQRIPRARRARTDLVRLVRVLAWTLRRGAR